ncbi:hypothetical protein U9M48_041404 [Paspalum notatum var. saurae]|uniref:Retrotransposon gag domain-containing protein n=1 Tax=Paspalum notatum var. saurae TaxID=547442 RepID=A0AAQ3UP07_PASNO
MAEPSNSDIIKALDVITKKLDTLDSHTTRLEQFQSTSLSAGGSTSFANGNQEARPPKFHKVDFPKFDGTTDPMLFLNKCESYFLQQRVVEEEKVWLASFNMDGAAQQWYMHLQKEEGTPNWRCFSELVEIHFGPPLRANQMGELVACRRTGTVEDYSTRFLERLARVPDPLRERQQIQLFTAG